MRKIWLKGGTNSKVRNSNLELFRIITMFLIVAHHYVVNSGLLSNGSLIFNDFPSFKSVFMLIFGAWGKTGINCFVLITGYFMCKSNITAKKFAKLFFEIMLYKILLYAGFLFSRYEKFSIVSFVKTIIPITSVSDGFSSTFLIFYLFIPFLNKLIKSINEKQHIKLLFLLGFTYVFFGTVPFFSVKMNYVS